MPRLHVDITHIKPQHLKQHRNPANVRYVYSDRGIVVCSTYDNIRQGGSTGQLYGCSFTANYTVDNFVDAIQTINRIRTKYALHTLTESEFASARETEIDYRSGRAEEKD